MHAELPLLTHENVPGIDYSMSTRVQQFIASVVSAAIFLTVTFLTIKFILAATALFGVMGQKVGADSLAVRGWCMWLVGLLVGGPVPAQCCLVWAALEHRGRVIGFY